MSHTFDPYLIARRSARCTCCYSRTDLSQDRPLKWNHPAGYHAVLVLYDTLHEKFTDVFERELFDKLQEWRNNNHDISVSSFVTERYHSKSYASLLTSGSEGTTSIGINSNAPTLWVTSAQGGAWNTGIYNPDKRIYTPACVLKTFRENPDKVMSQPFGVHYRSTSWHHSIVDGESQGSTLQGDDGDRASTVHDLDISSTSRMGSAGQSSDLVLQTHATHDGSHATSEMIEFAQAPNLLSNDFGERAEETQPSGFQSQELLHAPHRVSTLESIESPQASAVGDTPEDAIPSSSLLTQCGDEATEVVGPDSVTLDNPVPGEAAASVHDGTGELEVETGEHDLLNDNSGISIDMNAALYSTAEDAATGTSAHAPNVPEYSENVASEHGMRETDDDGTTPTNTAGNETSFEAALSPPDATVGTFGGPSILDDTSETVPASKSFDFVESPGETPNRDGGEGTQQSFLP